MSQQATIFALASAPGRAGVAVIRVSGRGAGPALDQMAGSRPAPRLASLRILRHPETGEALDQGLLLWFPAPGSFTGEDVVEFHVHGGRAVVQSVLSALAAMPDFRLAEPGEFARRAFEHGRLDLTQAEGLADLIDAETEAQRRQALRQAGGTLAALYDGWRGRLIEALALVEAAIDFSDEADVGLATFARAREGICDLNDEIGRHLDDRRRGEILRDGFHVALVGRPNVGKSSLLNALARREAAIVSEEAGTTRDVIEVRLDLDGLPVIISDTAGIRDALGAVEKEGVRRALTRAELADLVIWVVDATRPEPEVPAELAHLEARTLKVLNKADLVEMNEAQRSGGYLVSAQIGTGLDALLKVLVSIAREQIGDGEHPALTSVRHRKHLEDCQQALAAFQAGSEQETELRAEDLRQAVNALGRLTGRIDSEQVLDQIFGRFCIGK
jgi:tRNA modification GTPase